MNYKIVYLLLMVMVLFLTPSTHADTVGEAMSSLNPIDQSIDKALSKGSSILDEQQRQFLLNMTLLSGIFKNEMNDVIGNVDQVLTAHQSQMFNDLKVLSLEIVNLENKAADDMDSLVINMQNAITSIPFADKRPTPTHIEIPIFTRTQSGIYRINIKGSRLSNENNYIIINNKKYTNSSTLLPNELEFSITLSNDDIFDPNVVNVMEIHLFESRFFGILSDKERIYKTSYTVIDKNIGSIEVHYDIPSSNRHFTEYFTQITARTPGRCSWDENVDTINKRNSDHKMDRDTVTITRRSRASGGGSCYLHTAQFTDHTLEARATAKRCCQLGGISCGTGRTECRTRWREYKDIPIFPRRVITHDLVYQKGFVLKFPENTRHFLKVVVKFKDGSPDYESSNPLISRKHFKFEYDGTRKQANISI